MADLAVTLGRLRLSNPILKPHLDALTLRAPADGWVINPPRPDEVGKTFDHQQPAPFCTIGDPDRLRVLVPVKPSDYRLLKMDTYFIWAHGGLRGEMKPEDQCRPFKRVPWPVIWNILRSRVDRRRLV